VPAGKKKKQTFATDRIDEKSSLILGDIPAFFELFHQFLFQCGGPQRTVAAAPVNIAPDYPTCAMLRLNPFPILVSNLPADSIHSGGGSADRVIGRKFDYLNWSIDHEPTAAKRARPPGRTYTLG
jgi:hypothetical protein